MPLITNSQAKKKCQWRAIASHCAPGNRRSSSGRRAPIAVARRRWDTPSTPVVSNSRAGDARDADEPLAVRVRARRSRAAAGCRRTTTCPSSSAGMRVEDVEPAHEQDRQADDVDPVHHAHGPASDGRTSSRWRRRMPASHRRHETVLADVDRRGGQAAVGLPRGETVRGHRARAGSDRRARSSRPARSAAPPLPARLRGRRPCT